MGHIMRKLTFVANGKIQNQQKNSSEVQGYVTSLLTEKLTQYGFETLAQSGAQIAVTVDEHALPLLISCESRSADGHIVCEISSYPDENQDWLDRIAERSLLSQLAQAVESTLKDEKTLSHFEWSETI